MKKVLIVEDEQSIVKLLTYNLENEGFQVDAAMDGEEGYDMAVQGDYDMIILDLMLPSKDGIDVCRGLRQEKVDTPVIMLTAKDTEIDKIIGLEIGADDYMTKPFSPREVIARMKAIFRRFEKLASKKEAPTEEEEIIRVGDVEIFPDKYEVLVRGEAIELTPKEFDLLLYLARRQSRILSREQLLNAIWNYDFAGETRIVDVHISHLREKIEEDTKDPQYIKTARGFGYKFEAP
jgi:two-component system alkaline phosphatase synthesis response regulator PhoP